MLYNGKLITIGFDRCWLKQILNGWNIIPLNFFSYCNENWSIFLCVMSVEKQFKHNTCYIFTYQTQHISQGSGTRDTLEKSIA